MQLEFSHLEISACRTFLARKQFSPFAPVSIEDLFEPLVPAANYATDLSTSFPLNRLVRKNLSDVILLAGAENLGSYGAECSLQTAYKPALT